MNVEILVVLIWNKELVRSISPPIYIRIDLVSTSFM